MKERMRCLDLKTASEDGGGRQLQKRNRETMLGFEIKIVLLCVSLLPFFLSAFLGSVYGLQRPKEEERGEEEVEEASCTGTLFIAAKTRPKLKLGLNYQQYLAKTCDESQTKNLKAKQHQNPTLGTPKVGRGLGDLPNPNIRPPPEPGIRVPNGQSKLLLFFSGIPIAINWTFVQSSNLNMGRRPLFWSIQRPTYPKPTEASKIKMEHKDDIPSRSSGIRRTRSEESAHWVAQHLLILKWKIIVENCNALGVPHSSNQCRRKWSLLLQDYTKIKRWESQSALCDSYWSLGGQRRKEYELLENFDQDLFKAINDVVRLLEEKSGTDRDSDPEAQDDMVEITAELGPRKQRRHHAEAKPHKRWAVEKPKKIHVVEQLQESCAEEKPQRSEAEEGTWRIEAGENPEMSYMGIKHMFSVEEKEQIMVARLCEKAEQIHAVVEENFTENADHSAADVKNVEDFRTDFIRRQGDKLVACLGDILSTLNQFSELVQECE
ncbi:hypothetical protein QQP08_027555 [Theobroma cacao]|nr:hypothetical protein QQP08_027555 [Theobroma cacao]